MILRKPLWLVGAVLSLEGMRRGFIGGSALSLFVIKEFGLEEQAAPTLAFMRKYLDIEEEVITRIPPFYAFLLTPFIDYHNANKTFLKILDQLAELQKPSSCSIYWEKGE